VNLAIWTRPAAVVRVHDGDTIVADIDLGKVGRVRKSMVDLGWHLRETTEGHVILRSGIRIQGCAAPELVTPAGKTSARFAQTLLKPGDAVEIDSLALYGSFEKYGRVLASVKMPDGRDFAETMIAADQAFYWDGKGKQPVELEKAAAYDRALAVIQSQRDPAGETNVDIEPETAAEGLALQELDRLTRALCLCGHAENSDTGFYELDHSEDCPLHAAVSS
jgi:endonuclease YncB( thermonuclease family)